MLLGHILVMSVHAPATDQLPLVPYGGKKREKTNLKERQRHRNDTSSLKTRIRGKYPISGTGSPKHHNLTPQLPLRPRPRRWSRRASRGVNHLSRKGRGHAVRRLLRLRRLLLLLLRLLFLLLLLLQRSGRLLSLPQTRSY